MNEARRPQDHAQQQGPRLSYLELAPTDDETFAECPDAASLSF